MNIAVPARQSNLCYEDRLRVRLVQPTEEKALGRHLPVPKGGHERAGEGLFTIAFSGRARENGLKVKVGLD